MARRCGPAKSCGMRGGLFNPFFQNGVDLTGQNGYSSQGGASSLARSIYNDHESRVLADGGVIESEEDSIAFILDLINTYGVTDEAGLIAQLPVVIHPGIFGYKTSVGTVATTDIAVSTLYSLNQDTDLLQGTAANQPVLLVHSGENYYFHPRISNNDCRSSGTLAVNAYNSVTDTIRFTAKIWLPNISAGGSIDNLFTIGSAGLFQITNKGTAKAIRFRGTGSATTSSDYTPSLTAPHWIRITVNTTTVIYEWSADGTSWNAIGTPARPTVGTLGATFTWCNTAVSTANSVKVYHGTLENVTAGTIVTFDPEQYNRVANETIWYGVDTRWDITLDTAVTGLKGLLVDSTVVMGNGVDQKMASAAFALSQPYTAYVSRRRLGTGVVYGFAASSQLSNDATNSTVNNGAALNLANSSKASQQLTVVANGASSSITLNNDTSASGDAGSNGIDYIEILGNGASYGNFVFTSLIVSNGS